MTLRNSLLSLFLAAAGLAACSTPNPRYCEAAADCTEATADYCDIDGLFNPEGLTNTCVPMPASNPCNAVEQGDCSNNEVCLPGTSASDPGTCVDCLVDLDCSSNSTCDQATHECTATSCTQGAMGDEFCAMTDRDKPLCGTGDFCVECIASSDCKRGSDNVHCDTVVGECGACVANAECESGACDFAGDKCIKAEKVIYVDGSITASQPDCGLSRTNACKTIAEGLGKIDGDKQTLVILAGSYPESIVVSTGTVVLIGEGAVTINPSLAVADPNKESVLKVTGDAHVTAYSLHLIPSAAELQTDIVTCRGAAASLFLSGVEVRGSADWGVFVENCNIKIHRSTIVGNDDGGISIDAAPYELVNNFIVSNGSNLGGMPSANGGVKITFTTMVSEVFEFNTLADNGVLGSSLDGSALTCSGSNLKARNNIFVKGDGGGGAGTVVAAAGCTFEFSLFDEAMPDGDGNIQDTPKFMGGGNYHLLNTSPGIDVADPESAETVDFDGDARPLGAGKDMGADEFIPL